MDGNKATETQGTIECERRRRKTLLSIENNKRTEIKTAEDND